jgi:hypothetical protein
MYDQQLEQIHTLFERLKKINKSVKKDFKKLETVTARKWCPGQPVAMETLWVLCFGIVENVRCCMFRVRRPM